MGRPMMIGVTLGVGMLVTAVAGQAHDGHVQAAAATADGDKPPQVQRWELMDEVGKATQTLGAMAKGEAPYDAAAAKTALATIADNTRTFMTLFPEGSETGHETRALPAIWQDRSTFDQIGDESIAAATAATAAADGGLDAFRPAFQDLGATCRACHQDFRAEED